MKPQEDTYIFIEEQRNNIGKVQSIGKKQSKEVKMRENGLKVLKPKSIEPVSNFAKFYDDEERKLYASLKNKYKKF